MIANILGADAGIVLLIALVVLIGGSRLPKLARSIGLAGKEFRNAHDELSAEPPAVKPAASPAATLSAGDQVTLSRADLEALLDRGSAQATRDANA